MSRVACAPQTACLRCGQMWISKVAVSTDWQTHRHAGDPPPPSPPPWQQGRGGQSPFPKPCTEPSSKHAGPLFSRRKKSSTTCYILASCLRVFAAVGIPRLKPRGSPMLGEKAACANSPSRCPHIVYTVLLHTHTHTNTYVTKSIIPASALRPRRLYRITRVCHGRKVCCG